MNRQEAIAEAALRVEALGMLNIYGLDLAERARLDMEYAEAREQLAALYREHRREFRLAGERMRTDWGYFSGLAD